MSEAERIPAQLYLATPPLADAAAFAPLLTAALASGDIASLLIRFAGDEQRQNEEIVRGLAALAQPRGVAVIAAGDPNIALRAGADGAHVFGCGEALVEAVRKLAPRYIVGAGDFRSRDDAMRAGEAGADYVLLTDPAPAALVERVGWWAELINTPCVARAETFDEIAPLARAGADFVMIDDLVWRAPDIGAAVAQARTQLEAGGGDP